MKTSSWKWWFALLPILSAVPTWADEEDDDGEEHRGQRLKQSQPSSLRAGPEFRRYVEECGSCHLAYPPNLLPASSWSLLLAKLDSHFGQSAELDPATRQQLDVFLSANAGRDRSGLSPLRITELPWWRREHRKISSAVYARKSILTASNCLACHPSANEGAFGEHQVNIPRDAPPAR